MLAFYLKNFFLLNRVHFFIKKYDFIHPSDFFYFPRKIIKSARINFVFSLRIYKNFYYKNICRFGNKTLYGFLKKKNFIKLCRFNFMKFFFYGFMPYRFNTFIKKAKRYDYVLLNLFFFNSIGHIINLFPTNNLLFLYNIVLSAYFTINGAISKSLWSKLVINDVVSFYWSNFVFSQTLYFSRRNKLYIRWVTYNNYNWTPQLYTYILFIDLRQSLGVFKLYSPSFQKKNAFNFNTFGTYNWKFIT